MTYQDANSLKDILTLFVKRNKKIEKGLAIEQVKNSWKILMGKGVNNYTTDIIFINQTLYVSLSSAPLRQELSMSKKKIVKRINDHLGSDIVKKIILR